MDYYNNPKCNKIDQCQELHTFKNCGIEFKATWDEANILHGMTENRKMAEKTLKLKELLQSEESFNPKAFAENYLHAKKNKNFTQALGKQNLQHLDDLVTAAQALPKFKVSGLAKNIKTMGLVYEGLHAIMALSAMDFTQLATLGKVIAADTLLGKFLTSKKGLAKAAAFAKTPTTETAKQFNNTLKAELGLSLQNFRNLQQ